MQGGERGTSLWLEMDGDGAAVALIDRRVGQRL